MMDKSKWVADGWSVHEEKDGCLTISRDSEIVCGRCGQTGPWVLRVLPNGELAHRDYAVCRCGQMLHANTVWPDAPYH